MTSERRSPLDAVHRDLGARMTAFGGWDMPLSYPSGTAAEHRACRGGAVVFDVSHLGAFRLSGPDAHERLQTTFTNDLDRIGPGRAQYTHLLDDADGSVVDDLIVWWIDEHRFEVQPNASNAQTVHEVLGEAVTDVTGERVLLALQGPDARRLLHGIWPEAASVGRFRVERLEWDGAAGEVAGTGYTGEDGVEISLPAEAGEAFWTALTDAGFEPAGLGARDTLRLEMGLPLHGAELGPGITPLQAGLGWVIGWDKPAFPGRSALLAERERGVGRRLRALLADGRRPLRSGLDVLADGRRIGAVTSGTVSPMLERGIALALLEPSIEVGDPVIIDVRGRETPATVVEPPFVTPTAPRPVGGGV